MKEAVVKILKIERLDHLGIIVDVIKDLGIIDLIDSRIKPDKREKITAGEAVAAMIINGLGFSEGPLSLTPQFFENKPLELFFSKGVKAEDFNRFKLSRSLDDVFNYGCEQLFSEIALLACKKEQVDMRFRSVDTSSFSVTGEYDECSDEHAIKITHGFSKDHRPDLKQAILELIVTQDAGIPILQKAFSGNASDNKIFKERARALVENFKKGDNPSYLVADSKMYFEGNAINLRDLSFITRIPATIKEEKTTIELACKQKDLWIKIDEKNSFQSFEINHFGIKQNWIVVFSKAASDRAKKRIDKAEIKEYDKMSKKLKALSKKFFACPEDAKSMLFDLKKGIKFYSLDNIEILKKVKFNQKGRPNKNAEFNTHVEWQAKASLKRNEDYIGNKLKQESCYVIGTNIFDDSLPPIEIIKAYKRQGTTVEPGFRFLKDPIFFTSSFFIKKTSRIMALLMIMTLSLLVYSITQRRVRKYLETQDQTLPNQINQQTQRPTLRWLFRMLHGINIVYLKIGNSEKFIVEGITNIKKKILTCLGVSIQSMYGLINVCP